jgi:hypothetical protein
MPGNFQTTQCCWMRHESEAHWALFGLLLLTFSPHDATWCVPLPCDVIAARFRPDARRAYADAKCHPESDEICPGPHR